MTKFIYLSLKLNKSDNANVISYKICFSACICVKMCSKVSIFLVWNSLRLKLADVDDRFEIVFEVNGDWLHSESNLNLFMF